MTEFIKVSPALLQEHAGNIREDVHLYWRGCLLARYWMWKRLEKLVEDISTFAPGGDVLDMGGGLGLLLPSLSRHFQFVTLLDLETSVAEKIRRVYNLTNIQTLQANVLQHSFPARRFDTVIAAAFLEHFRQPDEVLERIENTLKPRGLLFVDLPTENWVYRLGRALGNIQKPPDHYHDAGDIKPLLLKRFHLVRERYLPPRPVALYYQAVLKKPEARRD